MALPRQLPSTRKLLAAAVALFVARLFYRFGRWIYHVLTAVDRSKQIQHNCIPPSNFKHTDAQLETLQLVKEQYPELVDLVENGNLIAVQPRKMLAALTEQQMGSSASAASGTASEERDEQSCHLSATDIHAIVSSPALQSCLALELPELMLFVGTVHVSKHSAEDVKRVLQAVRPSFVVMELCQERMQALLIDPYSDPLHDLEPCPHKMEKTAKLKNKSVPEILKAAMNSRDHNVLTAMMGGLYSQLEDKLEVRAGIEFIAARQTLIELIQAQQLQPPPADAQHNDAGHVWLQHCVPGDRAVMDTLLGLWGSLGPWRRLRFIGDLLGGLMSGIDEETIASLGKEDMVELLLKEFSEAYPEVMRPLLHDRNWVLTTNTWQVAQAAATEADDSVHGQQNGGKAKIAPVVAIVGKGHIPGMVYVVQWLVQLIARAGGKPVVVRVEEEATQEK